MLKEIVIRRYSVDDVLTNDGKLFNTNNHYNDEGLDPPDDYTSKINQGNTCNWIELFHKDNYQMLTLDAVDLCWMKKASQIGAHTGKFSHLFDDELEATCKKYKDMVPKGKWFIRTERVSLKFGQYGCGPYDDIEKILKSLVSSRIGHECFKADDTECRLYFMQWKDINPDKEFRIFVFNNSITAISTQNLYSVNDWLNSLNDNEIKDIVYKILTFFDENIKDKMSYMINYTMDLALIEPDDTPYFIEPNSFGKYYAAGSALFQWVIDHDILHDDSTIEFRYTFE